MEAEDPAEVSGSKAKTSKSGPRRVLVVDDNADVSQALAELLGMSGYEVQVAAGAEEAMTLFRQLPPQVAMLDIGLPTMDGHELAAKMREMPGGDRCAYIALTGYGMEAEREKSAQAGFRAHLVKPVDLKQLTSILEDCTGEAP